MLSALEELEEKKRDWNTKTIEYESSYNPLTDKVEIMPVSELVEQVKARIAELEAQRKKQLEIENCRRYNLQRKAEKERQISKCRVENLISEINKKSTV